MVHELPRGARLGVAHGNALADGLFLPQRRAESLALAHKVECALDGLRAVANRHRRQRNAFGLKVLHHRIKAFALFAKQIARRDAAVVKHQLSGVGRQPAGLVERTPHRKPGCAFFDDEHRHVMPRRASFGSDEIQVSMHAVGDEHLGAVEHPVASIALRGCAHARHVRTCAGLRDADRCDGVAPDDAWQITRLLRRRARMVQVRAGHVRVHQHRDDEAAESGLRQRFGKHQVGQRVGLAPAILRLVHQAK